MGKKRPVPETYDDKKEAKKEHLRETPEAMGRWKNACTTNEKLGEMMDPTGVNCEAWEEVAEETGYLDAAEEELQQTGTGQATAEQTEQSALEAPSQSPEDAQMLTSEPTVAEQRKIIEKYNSTINRWGTVAGALLAPLETVVESKVSVASTEAATAARSIKGIKTLKILKVTNNVLTHIGLITDMLGVLNAGIDLLEAKINSGDADAVAAAYDDLVGASAGMGKDLVLAACAAHPITLCFTVMNGILTAFDDQWLTKLINEDWDGPSLAEAITENLTKYRKAQGFDEELDAPTSGNSSRRQVENGNKRDMGFRPSVANPYLEALVAAVEEHNSFLGQDDEDQWVAEVKKWTLSFRGRDATEVEEIVHGIKDSGDYQDVLLWFKGDLSKDQFSETKTHLATVGL